MMKTGGSHVHTEERVTGLQRNMDGIFSNSDILAVIGRLPVWTVRVCCCCAAKSAE